MNYYVLISGVDYKMAKDGYSRVKLSIQEVIIKPYLIENDRKGAYYDPLDYTYHDINVPLALYHTSSTLENGT